MRVLAHRLWQFNLVIFIPLKDVAIVNPEELKTIETDGQLQ